MSSGASMLRRSCHHCQTALLLRSSSRRARPPRLFTTAATPLSALSATANDHQQHREQYWQASAAGMAGALALAAATITKCEAEQSPPQPPEVQATSMAMSMLGDSSPRNVMLQNRRSVRGRSLTDKYNVDWKTVLGEGAYGSVHPARHAATGEKVALKKISRHYTNASGFKTETDALLRIYDNGGHPNISGLRDMYMDHNFYFLILDLVSGGESKLVLATWLHSFVRSFVLFSRATALPLGSQCLSIWSATEPIPRTMRRGQVIWSMPTVALVCYSSLFAHTFILFAKFIRYSVDARSGFSTRLYAWRWRHSC